jgi:AraC family transcriptional regulator
VETIVNYCSDQNSLRIFEVAHAQAECPFRGIGIKYIASGKVTYQTHSRKYAASAGDYFIGNHFTSLLSTVSNRHRALVVEVDISPETIRQVAELHGIRCLKFSEYLDSDQFLFNLYSSCNSEIGKFLHSIFLQVQAGNAENFWLSPDVFNRLAEVIILDQQYIFRHLSKINFRNTSAKNDLFRALLNVKNFIDKSYLSNPTLDELCLNAGISRYHFCRLFKQVWELSPYQYLKFKKLELAKKEIMAARPIAEVSALTGFAEVSAFSKAFKQHFGHNPRELKKKTFA